jgi:uncharacterized protein YqgC (DUF456 family)
MFRVGRVGALVPRFIVCFLLTSCLWLVGVVFRARPESIHGYYLILFAALVFVAGTIRLYRTQPTVTVGLFTLCIILITVIDDLWEARGYFDDYMIVKQYALIPALGLIPIGAVTLAYKEDVQPNHLNLVIVWFAMIGVVLLVAEHVLIDGYGMIGRRYAALVFLALVIAEIVRQYRFRTNRREISGCDT